ncbi:uncharacterized protein TNCV_4425591 [Trichonephila clavipes]|nr:uncharacterized protein TNCV_4425591 [Trichonephila clavipes]
MMGRRLHLPGNVDDLARQLEQICRAYLGHFMQIPTTPINSLRTGKGSSGGVGQNAQNFINKLTDSMPQSLVVRASDSRPEGLGSMLDVTKYPPSAHGFTCRNCADRGRVAIYRPFGEVSLSLNLSVTCMVLKANDRRTSSPCHNEFRGPRSDYVRQESHCKTALDLMNVVDPIVSMVNKIAARALPHQQFKSFLEWCQGMKAQFTSTT